MADTDKPRLLSGGNPQIPKGDGPEPVARYLDAMPGWKQDAGRFFDDLVMQVVPNVSKAVRWNSPMYGLPDEGWFASVHCLNKAVRVTFFMGEHLTPKPPKNMKAADVRCVDLTEGEAYDAEQMRSWISQAITMPGWSP